MQDLSPVGDDFFSTALAVSDDRTVTGVSIGANDLRAVVREHGKPTDLNTVISGTPGIYLLTACSVNASGKVIGLAVMLRGIITGTLQLRSGAAGDVGASAAAGLCAASRFAGRSASDVSGLMRRRIEECLSLRGIFGIHMKTGPLLSRPRRGTHSGQMVEANNEDSRSMAATSAVSPVSLQPRTTAGWFYTCMGVFAFLFCIAAFGPSMGHSENSSDPSLR
jgi:hypothetical protein